MHAVCVDANAFHCPHIYCLVDRELEGEPAEDGKENHTNTNDIRIAPVDPEECLTLLDKLFAVFSDAASSMGPTADTFSGSVVTGDFNRKRKLEVCLLFSACVPEAFVLSTSLYSQEMAGGKTPSDSIF